MTVSLLVPFGADDSPAGAQRSRVWAWCRRRWEALLDMRLIDEIVVGHDPLHPTRYVYGQSFGASTVTTFPHPFSVSRALNDAVRHAHGEHLLIFGADHVPDPTVVVWAASKLGARPFIRLYDQISYATEAATQIILSNAAFPIDAADWHTMNAPCPGVIAVRRDVLTEVGGYNERFEGWGYEDNDLLDRLNAAYSNGVRGQMRASGHVLRELYVPSERDLNGPNKAIYEGTAQ